MYRLSSILLSVLAVFAIACQKEKPKEASFDGDFSISSKSVNIRLNEEQEVYLSNGVRESMNLRTTILINMLNLF